MRLPACGCVLLFTLAPLLGCPEHRDILDDDASPGDDDDSTPGSDDDDATPGDDDDSGSGGNHEWCAEPGDQELRFDAGVEDWAALHGDLTYDAGTQTLAVTADGGEVLSVTFQTTGVDLWPLLQYSLGPGKLLVASTGEATENGLVVLVSDMEYIFAAGFNHPGQAATVDEFGFELTVTPNDQSCPDPEWEDACGPAVASSAILYTDGESSPGVFSELTPGTTSDGIALDGNYLFSLYESWRLVESTCEDHPGREYSWSFSWTPGADE